MGDPALALGTGVGGMGLEPYGSMKLELTEGETKAWFASREQNRYADVIVCGMLKM